MLLSILETYTKIKNKEQSVIQQEVQNDFDSDSDADTNVNKDPPIDFHSKDFDNNHTDQDFVNPGLYYIDFGMGERSVTIGSYKQTAMLHDGLCQILYSKAIEELLYGNVNIRYEWTESHIIVYWTKRFQAPLSESDEIVIELYKKLSTDYINVKVVQVKGYRYVIVKPIYKPSESIESSMT